MRVMRPSRFAAEVFVILVVVGAIANVIFWKQFLDSYLPRGYHSPSVYTRNATETKQHWWPSVPEQDPPFEEPTSWERTDIFYLTRYTMLLGDGEFNYGVWVVLRDDYAGYPFVCVSSKEIRSIHSHGSSTLWPPVLDGSMYGPPAVTYHPLGLILNPIIYALPLWLVLMGVRWPLLKRRSRRRERLGLCVGCGYAIGDLGLCPECGFGVSGIRTGETPVPPG